jgi:hypothetical protein
MVLVHLSVASTTAVPQLVPVYSDLRVSVVVCETLGFSQLGLEHAVIENMISYQRRSRHAHLVDLKPLHGLGVSFHFYRKYVLRRVLPYKLHPVTCSYT